MINFLKEILKTRKRFQFLKKYFEPRREFLKESKFLFLQKVNQKDIKLTKGRVSIFPLFPSFRALAYVFASLLIIFIMSAGAIALAEKQNVSPDNPLYKLKRFGEQAQVQLAPEEKKTELHQKFAKRRLEEIKQIKYEIQKANDNKKDQEKLIEKQQKTIEELNEDFRKDISFVIETIETEIKQEPTPPALQERTPQQTEMPKTQTKPAKTSTETLGKNEGTSKEYENKRGKRAKNLCQTIIEMIQKHEEMENKSNSNWQEIKEKCKPVLEKDNKEGSNQKDRN